MSRKPKKPAAAAPAPPAFVNLRGEAVDPAALARKAAKAAAGGGDGPVAVWSPDRSFIPGVVLPRQSADVVLTPADLDVLVRALCLAGSPRSRAWLERFVHLMGWRDSQGHEFSTQQVQEGLRRLRLEGRVQEIQGQGSGVPAEERRRRLPELLAELQLRPAARPAWRAWAEASDSYQAATPRWPAPPHLRSRDDAVALARLLMYSELNAADFNQVHPRLLGRLTDAEVMAEALTGPFVPAVFEKLDAALRDGLLVSFAAQLASGDASWQPVLAWVEATVAAAPQRIPPSVRMLVAERSLHRGDRAGCERVLATITGPGPDLIRAALLAHEGHWPEAARGFAEALKQGQKEFRVKRGLAPASLLQWYVLSLLAQPDAAAWTQAFKFCVAESGSRQPPNNQSWGLWAHAAAVRLGDQTLEPESFEFHTAWSPRAEVDNNANRLILAGWLNHAPRLWKDAQVSATVRALHVSGQPWKADLVRQACERLGRPVPPRLPDDGPAWAPRFFGEAQEAWRDALAAIEALGGGAKADAGAEAEHSTLQWQIMVDREGRPIEVQPFERIRGARGWGKPKPVPLSRIKKTAQLDPRDAAVARCIDASRWVPSQPAIDVASATVALVGHPAVVLHDAPDQPVELREALPVLEVQRQRRPDGAEHFVFRLADALLAQRPPVVGDRFTASDPSAEAERRNGLRIVREAPDRARLIRISPAQRRVAELVAKDWAVPVAAQGELDAALRVLAGHFQLHSDADAGQAVPAEPRLRAQLSPSGEGLQLRLLVQPFGSFGPLLVPGQGRARLLTLNQGLNLSTERDLAAETAHLQAVLEALPFLAGGEAESSWRLDDPEEALAVVEALPRLPAVAGLDWPRGKPLRVVSTEARSLQIGVSSGADWLGVSGELRIDEHRVLGLQRVLELMQASPRGRYITLGDGEYLALGDQLRRQLADLQAMAQAEGQGLRVPAAAAAWLAETLEGAELQGDQRWRERQTLLEEAAALQPEPPASLQAQLRGYQAEGFAWMARLAHAGLGACLADDMGLGKTVQTLALLLARAGVGPALVIAPTSVCSNWVAEAQRFAPSLRVQLYGEAERATQLQGAVAGDLVVASYALAQIDAEALAAVEWATLVLDEAQALKNAATKRAKSVATLNAGFRLALTGTPVENRLADLWSIMNLLNPGLLGSANRFNERFANPIERGRDEGARQRLKRLVSPFLLRRTKAQVLADLPPRTEIIHRVEPGPEERAFLEAARRNAIERVAAVADTDGAGPAAFHVLAELTRLRRAACDPRLVAPELGIIGAKAQEFEQLATELVANRHKALVFSQFTDFLGLLAERLQAAGIRYQYLDGSTPAAERGKRVEAFQRGEGDLFLISLKAGGFGLNLTAADYVLIVDPWWNPAAEDQAMGRAHRIGQQRPVTVYRLVTAGSIEERIVALHQDKRALADGILEGQDGAAPLRPDELRELLADPE